MLSEFDPFEDPHDAQHRRRAGQRVKSRLVAINIVAVLIMVTGCWAIYRVLTI